MTRLTELGTVRAAAVSSDGRYVAYSTYEAGKHSLWVREVSTTDSMQIIPPASGDDYLQMTFSPDGREVYYVKYEEDREMRALYRVPARGGESSRVLGHVDSPISFSPDGDRFVFVRRNRNRKESSLTIARTDGGGQRMLVTRREPEWLAFSQEAWAPPARMGWSPDGRTIAYAVGIPGGTNDHQVWSVPAAGGAERLLSPKRWWSVDSVAWLGDGRALLMLAAEEQFSPRQIWRLSLSGGEASRLTDDPDGLVSMSATADARVLAVVQFEEITGIWVGSSANLKRFSRVLSRKTDGRWGLSWTTDQKILYDSKISGRQEIWVMDADGGNRRRLTSGAAADDAPAVSPDGRYIVYSSRRGSNDITHIWRMDRDGGNPRQLTFGSGEYDPHCSSDGRWVVYVSRSASGKSSVMRTMIDGGISERITVEDEGNPNPAVSPDGKFLAYYRSVGNDKKQVEVITFSGGPPVRVIKVPETAYLLKWAADGRALTYANDAGGVANIWRHPLYGEMPRQLTFFEAEIITLFDWSSDGTRLVCTRKANYEDVTLISDIR
jgi:TolB protein